MSFASFLYELALHRALLANCRCTNNLLLVMCFAHQFSMRTFCVSISIAWKLTKVDWIDDATHQLINIKTNFLLFQRQNSQTFRPLIRSTRESATQSKFIPPGYESSAIHFWLQLIIINDHQNRWLWMCADTLSPAPCWNQQQQVFDYDKSERQRDGERANEKERIRREIIQITHHQSAKDKHILPAIVFLVVAVVVAVDKFRFHEDREIKSATLVYVNEKGRKKETKKWELEMKYILKCFFFSRSQCRSDTSDWW